MGFRFSKRNGAFLRFGEKPRFFRLMRNSYFSSSIVSMTWLTMPYSLASSASIQ